MNYKDDQFHCRCFRVNSQDVVEIKQQLESLKFYKEFEEDHGQILGLVLRVKDDLQLHFKVMPDGIIESEMEPPPAYPAAHINQEHSYSAHHELQQLFSQYLSVWYSVKPNTPSTCIDRIVKKPVNPTHAATFAALGGLAVLGGLLVKHLLKDDDKNNDE